MPVDLERLAEALTVDVQELMSPLRIAKSTRCNRRINPHPDAFCFFEGGFLLQLPRALLHCETI
jgi:hypothetical protein